MLNSGTLAFFMLIGRQAKEDGKSLEDGWKEVSQWIEDAATEERKAYEEGWKSLDN